METRTAVERVRALFRQTRPSQEYERIEDDPNDEDVRRPVLIIPDKLGGEPFSWFEYSIFVLLGIAMLWAWYVTTLCTFKAIC
jgi:equilibrative nucleoside transporter 1/2/3